MRKINFVQVESRDGMYVLIDENGKDLEQLIGGHVFPLRFDTAYDAHMQAQLMRYVNLVGEEGLHDIREKGLQYVYTDDTTFDLSAAEEAEFKELVDDLFSGGDDSEIGCMLKRDEDFWAPDFWNPGDKSK